MPLENLGGMQAQDFINQNPRRLTPVDLAAAAASLALSSDAPSSPSRRRPTVMLTSVISSWIWRRRDDCRGKLAAVEAIERSEGAVGHDT